MNLHKSTVQKAMIMARIVAMAIVFMLGHDTAMAADLHAEVFESHSTAVEQCTIVEGSAQIANATSSFSFEIDSAADVSTIWAYDLVGKTADSIAPPPNPTSLRIAIQVFLN